LDVVALPLRLEQVERCPLRAEQDGAEFQLALDGEVLHSQMVFPVVGQGLVERPVLLRGDVLRVPSPERLHLVELFGLLLHFFDLPSRRLAGVGTSIPGCRKRPGKTQNPCVANGPPSWSWSSSPSPLPRPRPLRSWPCPCPRPSPLLPSSPPHLRLPFPPPFPRPAGWGSR
ncbi:MAG: hypothetical protein BJ554DRAFT_2006, partial [Olpidium bornovanus]